MNEQTFQLISGITQSVIALAALIASIAIPLILYKAQKRRETLEFIHAVRTMWVSIDTVILQRDDLIEVADSILDPRGKEKDIKERQRSWIALMVLNTVYMDYLGAKNGFHSQQALQTITNFLQIFLTSDTAYQMTQNDGAYDSEFRAHCSKIKLSIDVTKGNSKPI